MDPATTLLSVGYGNSGSVWVTREANYFDTQPTFAKVVDDFTINGLVSTMEWSKSDENEMRWYICF